MHGGRRVARLETGSESQGGAGMDWGFGDILRAASCGLGLLGHGVPYPKGATQGVCSPILHGLGCECLGKGSQSCRRGSRGVKTASISHCSAMQTPWDGRARPHQRADFLLLRSQKLHAQILSAKPSRQLCSAPGTPLVGCLQDQIRAGDNLVVLIRQLQPQCSERGRKEGRRKKESPKRWK